MLNKSIFRILVIVFGIALSGVFTSANAQDRGDVDHQDAGLRENLPENLAAVTAPGRHFNESLIHAVADLRVMDAEWYAAHQTTVDAAAAILLADLFGTHSNPRYRTAVIVTLAAWHRNGVAAPTIAKIVEGGTSRGLLDLTHERTSGAPQIQHDELGAQAFGFIGELLNDPIYRDQIATLLTDFIAADPQALYRAALAPSEPQRRGATRILRAMLASDAKEVKGTALEQMQAVAESQAYRTGTIADAPLDLLVKLATQSQPKTRAAGMTALEALNANGTLAAQAEAFHKTDANAPLPRDLRAAYGVLKLALGDRIAEAYGKIAAFNALLTRGQSGYAGDTLVLLDALETTATALTRSYAGYLFPGEQVSPDAALSLTRFRTESGLGYFDGAYIGFVTALEQSIPGGPSSTQFDFFVQIHDSAADDAAGVTTMAESATDGTRAVFAAVTRGDGVKARIILNWAPQLELGTTVYGNTLLGIQAELEHAAELRAGLVNAGIVAMPRLPSTDFKAMLPAPAPR